MAKTKIKWKHVAPGKYAYKEGPIDALVLQADEFWRSFVYFEGVEVDRGEWDGRGTALSTAASAIKRALDLRRLDRINADADPDEDDDDD